MALNRELLVVLGDPVVELVSSAPLHEATSFERRLAGRAVTVGLHAARAGQATALLTRVGDDAFADWLLETLDRHGVHLDHARRVPGRNSVRLVGGDDASAAYRDAAPAVGVDIEQCTAVPWELCRHLFACGSFQSLGVGATALVRRCFELARANGARTIFYSALTSDLWPGGPRAATAAFDELIGLIDVLVVSSPYASGRLLSQPEPEKAVRAALKRGVGACLAFQDWGLAAVGELASGGSIEDLTGWDVHHSIARFVTGLNGGMSATEAARHAATTL